MGALSSATTRQQVLDAIADNASWLADNDVAKAKLYHEALSHLIDRWLAEEVRNGDQSVREDLETRQRQRERVESFIQANAGVTAGGAGVVLLDPYASVGGWRGW